MPDSVTLSTITGPGGEAVRVRRSTRRRRTVEISRRDGELLVAIPAAMSRREEQRTVRRLVDSIAAREERSRPAQRSDTELLELARRLGDRYLDGRARPASVAWSARQQQRWGSCTTATGEIRLSTRLQDMPSWVLESVVMHELVHLLVPDHGPDFQELMDRYPRAERARGFLEGVSWSRDAPGARA